MPRLSLRARLTIIYGALLFLALAIAGGTVVALLRHRLHQRLDESLDRRLQGVEAFLRRETSIETAHKIPLELEEYASTQPEGHLIEVRDEAGRLLLKSHAVSSTSRSRERDFTLYGQVFRTRASGSLASIEESLQEMTYLFVAIAPLLLLIIGITGYWISSRSLRPVDEMTRAARSIGAFNLSARLPVPSAGDELGRLAEAWNEMLGRLEESFARTQQFTADAAHEFRTPLTGLRTTAELALVKPRDPQEYREALAQMVVITDRMSRLSDALLALAQGEDLIAIRQSGSVDLASLLDSVTEEMAPVFRQKDLAVSSQFRKRPVLANADADSLRRLVAALLDNARKYTPEGGSISLLLDEDATEVVLAVSDTGCGIPGELLTKIFDRFYRTDPSRDRKTGGFGLGLAIAQQIARAHQGWIEASSIVGHGATFRLHLPKTV